VITRVELHTHAKAQLRERGAAEEEVALKLDYDPKYNVAYIQFHEKQGQGTTIKISDDMNIDIAPDGTVYGVELLNANEQLTGDQGALIVESSGRRQKIPLVT
jgi:uncharacterized protein YuzE